ncbi:MAG TPA: M20 family metallopeptidase [Solirubrobacterales bacterium]|nr:M20 family metallopeptidase [Solirubrobacterales bacterium]
MSGPERATGRSEHPAAGAAGNRLLEWLRGHQDEMTDLLARLARAESPTLEPQAQREAASILEAELRGLGLAVERIPGNGTGDHLLAAPAAPEPDGGAGVPAQLLVGHLDTVWPLGTIDEMPVRLRDGMLFGPGVFDMKGGLVQMLFALRALGELGIDPAARPLVFVNTDEEIGSPHSRAHLEPLARGAIRAFVLEPALGAAGKLKTARKGVGRFRLRLRGQASHAGLDPEAGVSAILEASHQIQRLFELNDRERGTTVNVGTIDGGLRPNVVAPEVVAEVEARVVSAEDADRVEGQIRSLEPVAEGISLEVEGGFGRPPLERTPRNRELWELALGAAAELGTELEEALAGGASDGNLLSAHTATLDGLGAVGEGAHARDEHVIVDRMPERAALLAMLLASPPRRTTD